MCAVSHSVLTKKTAGLFFSRALCLNSPRFHRIEEPPVFYCNYPASGTVLCRLAPSFFSVVRCLLLSQQHLTVGGGVGRVLVGEKSIELQ